MINAFYFTQRTTTRFFAAFAMFSLLAGLVPTQAFASVQQTSPYGNSPISKVDVCHRNEGHGFNVLNVSVESSGLPQGGHANHASDIIPPYFYTAANHTTQFYAGKNWTAEGQDVWNNGQCNGDGIVPPPPVDVCPNIPEVQSTVPQGYQLVDGQCVPVPPPVDVCSNIQGNQATVPEGYYANDGQCFPNPVDMCPNIEGTQATVPEGLIVNNDGNCVTPPVDVCPNLPNLQTTVPAGYHLADGQCVPDAVDMCPNIEGTQATVPEGLIVNNDGNCVTPPVDVCPNLEGAQATVPEGYELSDGQCVPVPPPVDVCSNIQGNQATVPEGYYANDGQCLPNPVDVCPNIEGNQSVIPEGYHLNNDNQCVPDVPTCATGFHLVDNECVANGGGGAEVVNGCTNDSATNFNSKATAGNPDATKCDFNYVSQCGENPNLLLNGSFEDPVVTNPNLWDTFASITGWTSTNGIELWHGILNGPSLGLQNAELDTNGNSTISQSVATIPGATYELRFDFAARSDASSAADNSVKAMADTTTVVNHSTANTNWTTYGGTFVASSTAASISLADMGTSNGLGTVVDNAVLCLVRTPEQTVDVCSNLEGNQATVPEGYTANDGICTQTPSGGGGSVRHGNSSGGGSNTPSGEVLGASDSKPQPEVLGAQVTAVPAGAPNAGAGGAAPFNFGFVSVAPVAFLRRNRIHG
jgi:Protein of unknown function (DUF642)